jgi:hypothetical protein
LCGPQRGLSTRSACASLAQDDSEVRSEIGSSRDLSMSSPAGASILLCVPCGCLSLRPLRIFFALFAGESFPSGLGTQNSRLARVNWRKLKFPNPASILFSSGISTLQQLRARGEKIDLHFHECAKKRENSGDFADVDELVAPKCGSGL